MPFSRHIRSVPLLLLLLCGGSAALRAQALTSQDAAELPEDPGQYLTGQRPAATATTPGTARLSGTVIDINGGLVPGAVVTITARDRPGAPPSTATADANGSFSVGGLPPGNYSVTITSPGLETYTGRDIRLRAGEAYVMPHVSLPIARTAADVTVSLTEEQVAETQLNAELKQRVLGVFPNFYTTFEWDAAPLSAGKKFKLAARSFTDPVAFVTTAGIAGAEQINGTFPEYGSGFPGYARRYGAAYGDAVISRMMGSVIFASLLHQDPRYFVMGTGTAKRRAWHAVSSAFIQRGDNRRWQPAYSNLLGNAATGALASTYHPGGPGAGMLVLDDTLIGLGGRAFDDLFREFVLPRFTTHVPDPATRSRHR